MGAVGNWRGTHRTEGWTQCFGLRWEPGRELTPAPGRGEPRSLSASLWASNEPRLCCWPLFLVRFPALLDVEPAGGGPQGGCREVWAQFGAQLLQSGAAGKGFLLQDRVSCLAAGAVRLDLYHCIDGLSGEFGRAQCFRAVLQKKIQVQTLAFC